MGLRSAFQSKFGIRVATEDAWFPGQSHLLVSGDQELGQESLLAQLVTLRKGGKSNLVADDGATAYTVLHECFFCRSACTVKTGVMKIGSPG